LKSGVFVKWLTLYIHQNANRCYATESLKGIGPYMSDARISCAVTKTMRCMWVILGIVTGHMIHSGCPGCSLAANMPVLCHSSTDLNDLQTLGARSKSSSDTSEHW